MILKYLEHFAILTHNMLDVNIVCAPLFLLVQSHVDTLDLCFSALKGPQCLFLCLHTAVDFQHITLSSWQQQQPREGELEPTELNLHLFARHIHRLQFLRHLLSYGEASSAIFLPLPSPPLPLPLPPAGPQTLTLTHYDNAGQISISLSNSFTDNASNHWRRHSF